MQKVSFLLCCLHLLLWLGKRPVLADEISWQLQISPEILDFGEREMGQVHIEYITLSNTGIGTFLVDQFSWSASFKILNQSSFPVSLTPGTTIQLAIAFVPTTNYADGNSNHLWVRPESAGGNDILIRVTGRPISTRHSGAGMIYSIALGGGTNIIDPYQGIVMSGPEVIRDLDAIAIDKEGMAYAIGRYHPHNSDDYLLAIDLNQGSVVHLAKVNRSNYIDLDFDDRGNLYALTNNRYLYRVTRNPVQFQQIGWTFHQFSSMTIDPLTGECYAVDSSSLYRLNLTNAKATLVGSIGYITRGLIGPPKNIFFDSMGNLLGMKNFGNGTCVLWMDKQSGHALLGAISTTGHGDVALAFSPKSSLRPELTVFPSVIDFDNVLIGESQARTVTLYNYGGSPVTVTEIGVTNSRFRLANVPGLPLILPSGQRAEFQISYEPTAASVSDKGIINIVSDVADWPDHLVSVRGAALEPFPSAKSGSIYALQGYGGRIMRLDPMSGQLDSVLIETNPFTRAVEAIAVDTDSILWGVDSDGQIFQINPETGKLLAIAYCGLTGIRSLSVDDENNLLALSDGWLYGIDPLTGEVIQRIDLQYHYADMAVDFRERLLWFVNNNKNLIAIDLDNPTAGAKSVWIRNPPGDEVDIRRVEVDPAGNPFVIFYSQKRASGMGWVDPNTGEIWTTAILPFPGAVDFSIPPAFSEVTKLQVQPTSIEFGEVVANFQATRPMNISNLTAAPITISQIAITPPTPNFSWQSNRTLPVTLASGESLTITVAFQRSFSLAHEQTELHITNTGMAPLLTIPISGEIVDVGAAEQGLLYTLSLDDRLTSVDGLTHKVYDSVRLEYDRISTLAINSSGQIFGFCDNGADMWLYRIDPQTGRTIPTVAVDPPLFGKLAFDKNDQLLLVAWQRLYTVNLSTGKATKVADVQQYIDPACRSPFPNPDTYCGAIMGQSGVVDAAINPQTNDVWIASGSLLQRINRISGAKQIYYFPSSTGNGSSAAYFTSLYFDGSGTLRAVAGKTVYSVNLQQKKLQPIMEIPVSDPVSVDHRFGVVTSGRIRILPRTIDFGLVSAGVPETRTMYLINYGASPLIVTSLSTDGGYFHIVDPPATPITIAGGSWRTIEISCAPSNQDADRSDAHFIVDSTANHSPVTRVPMRANVIHVAEPGDSFAITYDEKLVKLDLHSWLIEPVANYPYEGPRTISISEQGEIVGITRVLQLVQVDAHTGEFFVLDEGPVNIFESLIRYGDDLIGLYSDGRLYRVEIPTGLTQPLGTADTDLRGIAYAPQADQIWGTDGFNLFQIDILTGSISRHSTLALKSLTHQAAFQSLLFDEFGNLYSLNAEFIDNAVSVFAVDTATGIARLVTRLSDVRIRSIARRPWAMNQMSVGVSPAFVDFGNLTLLDQSTRTVAIHNKGQVPVTVRGIGSAIAGLSWGAMSFPIQISPHESVDVELMYSAPNHDLNVDGIWVIQTDAADQREIRLPVYASTLTPADYGCFYGINGARELIKVDPTTGAAQQIGLVGLPDLSPLWIDDTGTIHVFQFVPNSVGRSYRISASTGTAYYDHFARIPYPTTGVWRADDTLWITDPDFVYQYDLSKYTAQQHVNWNADISLVFDSSTNTLFGLGTNKKLYRVDPATFGRTELLTLPSDVPFLGSLAFDNAGILYGAIQDDQLRWRLVAVDRELGSVHVGKPSAIDIFCRWSMRPGTPTGRTWLQVFPSSVDFGELRAGESRTRHVLLANYGDQAITIQSLSISSPEFRLERSQSLPAHLDERMALSLSIVYNPTTNRAAQNGVLNIVTDDSHHPSVDVFLTGALPPIVENELCVGVAVDGYVYSLDLTTGRQQPLIHLELEWLRQLAVNPEGIFHAYIYDYASGFSFLHRVNLQNGTSVPMNKVFHDLVGDFTFADAGRIYLLEGNDISLVNLENRQTSHIHTSHYFNGLSVDPLNGTLWVCGPSGIARILPTDANSSPVQVTFLPRSRDSRYRPKDLYLDAAGNLFALGLSDNADRSADCSALLAVDKVSGAMQVIGVPHDTTMYDLGGYQPPTPHAQLRVHPPEIAFPPTVTGESVEVDLVLSNIGASSLFISDMILPNSSFEIVDEPDFPLLIESRDHVRLSVLYRHETGSSARSTMTIASHGSDYRYSTVPLTAQHLAPVEFDVGIGIAADDLYSIDWRTADVSFLSRIDLPGISCIAVNSHGELMAICNRAFYRVNPTSGAAKFIAESRIQYCEGFVYDGDDSLFMLDDGFFASVDLASNQYTRLGTQNYLVDLAVDPTDDSLWACSNYKVYMVDKETGAATELSLSPILSMPGVNFYYTMIFGIGFDAWGTLYAIASDGYVGRKKLIAINKHTGAMAGVGVLPDGIDVRDIANRLGFAPGPRLAIEDVRLEFKSSNFTQSQSQWLAIRNDGGDPGVIERIDWLGGANFHFREPVQFPLIIPARGRIELPLAFNPDHIGFTDDYLTVTTNDAQTPSFVVALAGLTEETNTQRFDLELDIGWNLISVPIFPNDPAVWAIFDNDHIKAVWQCDGTTLTTASEIVPKWGYWVYSVVGGTVPILGQPVRDNEMSPTAEWMATGPVEEVPFRSIDRLTFFQRMRPQSDNQQPIWFWDGRRFVPANTIQPGRGYLVHSVP